MARKFCVGVVATQALWGRIPNLISSLKTPATAITIASEEPSCLPLHRSNSQLWERYVQCIRHALLANLTSISKDNINELMQGASKAQYPWMKYRALTKSELSLYYKHLTLLRTFANSSYDYLVVMEDDAIIGPRFWSQLSTVLILEDFDYIDLAGGCSLTLKNITDPEVVNNEESFELFKVPWKSSRTTCAYVISHSCACAFVNSPIEHFIVPVDWAFTLYFCSSCSNKVYWSEGIDILHGSENGTYKSSIERIQ